MFYPVDGCVFALDNRDPSFGFFIIFQINGAQPRENERKKQKHSPHSLTQKQKTVQLENTHNQLANSA